MNCRLFAIEVTLKLLACFRKILISIYWTIPERMIWRLSGRHIGFVSKLLLKDLQDIYQERWKNVEVWLDDREI